MLPCALPLCASRTYQRGHCPPRSAAPSLRVKVVPVWTFPPSPSGSSPAAMSATAWSSASTPPVGPRRPKRPARDSGRGARAGLPAPSRLPLGAGGRGQGPRFSAAARRSPSRRPPAPARRRLPAAPARRGGRRRRERGRCGYGRGTAVAVAVTGCGNSGRNGGDARGTGPLLVRRVPYKKRGRDIPGFLTLNPGLPKIAVETDRLRALYTGFPRNLTRDFGVTRAHRSPLITPSQGRTFGCGHVASKHRTRETRTVSTVRGDVHIRSAKRQVKSRYFCY